MEEWGAPVSVELEKSAGGVGFTLEGGKGSIHGDRPLVIKRIFNGTQRFIKSCVFVLAFYCSHFIGYFYKKKKLREFFFQKRRQ